MRAISLVRFRDHNAISDNLFPGLSRLYSAPVPSSNIQQGGVNASTDASSPAEEEWTEVVHAEGGERCIYYWNQKTGTATVSEL